LQLIVFLKKLPSFVFFFLGFQIEELDKTEAYRVQCEIQLTAVRDFMNTCIQAGKASPWCLTHLNELTEGYLSESGGDFVKFHRDYEVWKR